MREYKKYLKNMFQFEGRARRREYWVVNFMNTTIRILLYFLLFATCTIEQRPIIYHTSGGYGIRYLPKGSIVGLIIMALIVIWEIFVFVSMIGLTVRRFHDVGVPGWVYPICLVGYCLCGIGAIVQLVIMLLPSKEDNLYGVNPKLPENNEYENNKSIFGSVIVWFIAFVILMILMCVNVSLYGVDEGYVESLFGDPGSSRMDEYLDDYDIDDYDPDDYDIDDYDPDDYDIDDYDPDDDYQEQYEEEEIEDDSGLDDLEVDTFEGKDADGELYYTYATVTYEEDCMNIKPNGIVDGDTVIYNGKTVGEFCDYIDEVVLEKGRCINRYFLYDLISVNVVEEDAIHDKQSLINYLLFPVTAANEFYNTDVSIDHRTLYEVNPNISYDTVVVEGKEDIWVFDQTESNYSFYLNDGKTEYHSTMLENETLSIWAAAIEAFFIKL